MKYHFKKDIYWSLKSIENLHIEKPFKTVLPNFPLDGCMATSKRQKNGTFKINFFLENSDIPFVKDVEELGVNENIQLINGDEVYLIHKGSVKKITRTLSVPSIVSIEVNNFQKGENIEFDNNIIRLIIPCKKEPTLDVFDCKSVHISGTTTFRGLIEVCVKEKYYHVFKHKNDDSNKKYLIIDSLEKNSLKEFKENTSSILLAYGYVTGNLLLDEYYYSVDFRKNKTKRNLVTYEKKEESIITNASLFSPFEFEQYLKHFKREDLLAHINCYLSRESFSRISERIAQNETFARSINLILHGNKSRTLLLRAGIYSIALETITNIIYEENQEAINPISDKKLSAKIQDKFKAVLEEYDCFLSDYGKQIINAKINDLNKPTNSKKLTKPFEIYGIELTKSDIEILNHRNKFLHGSSPFEENELKDKDKDLKYISSKLLSLLNVLILKYCGYKGHVIDFGGWHQLKWEEKVTDHLFKII